MSSYSYQLYSSRAYSSLSRTMQMLKDAGYQDVEGYDGLFEDMATLKASLDGTGLTMRSAHFDLDKLHENPGDILDIAQMLNMEFVYCPYLAPENRPDDAPGWRVLGQSLQEISKYFKDSGLIFGWHNHDYEFQQQSDGSLPMEELFASAPDLSWEIDVAWIVRGDGDPAKWINKYAERISAVHIKDLAPSGKCLDEDGWADVGFGVIEWPRIWKELANTSVSLFVLEHDNPNDHQRFANRSLSAVRSFQE